MYSVVKLKLITTDFQLTELPQTVSYCSMPTSTKGL